MDKAGMWQTLSDGSGRVRDTARYYAMEARRAFEKTLSSPAGRWALTAVVVTPVFLGAASKASAALAELGQTTAGSGLLDGLSGQAAEMLKQGVTIPSPAAAMAAEWTTEVSRVCVDAPQDVGQSMQRLVDAQKQAALRAEALAHGGKFEHVYGKGVREGLSGEVAHQADKMRPGALPASTMMRESEEVRFLSHHNHSGAMAQLQGHNDSVDVRATHVGFESRTVEGLQRLAEKVEERYPGAMLGSTCEGPSR